MSISFIVLLGTASPTVVNLTAFEDRTELQYAGFSRRILP